MEGNKLEKNKFNLFLKIGSITMIIGIVIIFAVIGSNFFLKDEPIQASNEIEAIKVTDSPMPSFTPLPTITPITKPYTNQGTQALFEDVNKYRVSLGLNPLQRDARLDASACAKAQDMNVKQYWEHYGPDGETPWQFIIQAGYQYKYAGENLARDFLMEQPILAGWIKSPSHNSNLINPNYKDVGYCIVVSMLPLCPNSNNLDEPTSKCDGKLIKSISIVQHLGVLK